MMNIMQIDTFGSGNNFSAIRDLCIKNANAYLIVYSIIAQSTFNVSYSRQDFYSWLLYLPGPPTPSRTNSPSEGLCTRWPFHLRRWVSLIWRVILCQSHDHFVSETKLTWPTKEWLPILKAKDLRSLMAQASMKQGTDPSTTISFHLNISKKNIEWFCVIISAKTAVNVKTAFEKLVLTYWEKVYPNVQPKKIVDRCRLMWWGVKWWP